MAVLSLIDRVAMRVHPSVHPACEARGWQGVLDAALAADAARDHGLLRALNKPLTLDQARHVLQTYVPKASRTSVHALLSDVNARRAYRGEPPVFIPEGTTTQQALRALQALRTTL
jgi:hypothetical protein